MLKEITIVILVINPLLNREIWKVTSRQFMKAKGTTNVIFVENYSLNQEIWKTTSSQFMRSKEITNVIIVENPSLNQDIWRNTSRQFTKDKKLQMWFMQIIFHLFTSSNNHIKTIHEGQRNPKQWNYKYSSLNQNF